MDDEQDEMLAGLKSLAMDGDDLAGLEVEAFEWSDKAVRYTI